MLNMALLNILSSAGAGGINAPNTAPYNILGLMSPGVISENGHMPFTILIWNRWLTTFQSNFRCEDTGSKTIFFVGGGNTICADGGPQIGFTETLQPSSWGVSTSPALLWGVREMSWGYINMHSNMQQLSTNLLYNELMYGYANYYDYLPDLPWMRNSATTQLSAENFLGGRIWQTGVKRTHVVTPFATEAYAPNNAFTKIPGEILDSGDQWLQKVVPLRGVTKFPRSEHAKNCIGFMQLETKQIGYGISYSFGISQDPNCLPKKSTSKCGGISSGTIKDTSAPLIAQGFCVIDLDMFLDAFREEGLLNSVQDLSTIYNKLNQLILDQKDVSYASLFSDLGSGAAYRTHDSIWQGFIDGWLEQPYKRIFQNIGGNDNYYINYLQTNYPNEANFHSIMGCGRSFDGGVFLNSTICALNDCLSVFKAASTFPDLFPVDFEAYFRS